MADGRGKMEWAQTSNLMALIVNVMRDPKKSKAVKIFEKLWLKNFPQMAKDINL